MKLPLNIDQHFAGPVDLDLYSIGLQLEEVRQQPIVNRQEQVVGFETLAKLNIEKFGRTVEDVISRLSMSDLGRLTSELLLGLRIRCLLGKNYANQMSCNVAGPEAKQFFVNVEKKSLTDPALVGELIESAADLLHTGCRLVVEVTERPLVNADQFRCYMKGLMRLKQEDVLIALDDYDIDSAVHWELDLGLCDVVKLDIPDLNLIWREHEGTLSAGYSVLAEKLYDFIHRYRVDLLAEKIETNWQYEALKGLPFNLFQGYRFGRPERV